MTQHDWTYALILGSALNAALAMCGKNGARALNVFSAVGCGLAAIANAVRA